MNYIPHSKPLLRNVDLESLQSTFKSNQIASGYKVTQFEKKLSSLMGHNPTYVFNSGTASLVVALKMLDLPPESEVIIPTYTCKNLDFAVRFCNLQPVYCDNGDDWVISKNTLSDLFSSKTSAIIAVNTFGRKCRTDELAEFDVPIIEDHCQSFSTHSSSSSWISIFSFHATKCIATGSGGALRLHPLYFERVPDSRSKIDEQIPLLRAVFAISDLQASIGISQLNDYTQFLKRRWEISEIFLKNLNLKSSKLPDINDSQWIMPFRFPLKTKLPFEFVKESFEDAGIHVRRGVDNLLHRSLKLKDDYFPNASNDYTSTVCLPIYPALTDLEIEKIITAANGIL